MADSPTPQMKIFLPYPYLIAIAHLFSSEVGMIQAKYATFCKSKILKMSKDKRTREFS
ncbi:MAG: hypothetical protein RMX63_27295 [Aulosira sp. ZfuCHP01]|nr:hypothetical protein [Aulosira sp. DedVER01a]MDZ8055124.1 hypothetical protein [Aulosira sp. ZfuCHP01]